MKTEASNPLKSVLDDCEATMKSSGNEYKRLSEDALMVNLLDKRHVIDFTKSDDEYVRIIATYGKNSFEGTRAECIARANFINQRVKVVKIIVDDEDDFIFSVEMFLDQARLFSDIFQRQIQAIDTGVRLFFSDGADVQTPKQTEDAESNVESNWLSSVLDSCELLLGEEDIPSKRTAHNKLLYTMKGQKISLTFEDEDQGYLSLVTMEDSQKFHCSRKKMLEVVNSINDNLKVAKAYLNSDGELVCSAEVFLNSGTDFTRILRRHSSAILESLHSAITAFNVKK